MVLSLYEQTMLMNKIKFCQIVVVFFSHHTNIIEWGNILKNVYKWYWSDVRLCSRYGYHIAFSRQHVKVLATVVVDIAHLKKPGRNKIDGSQH